ncbi:MAG: aldehyde dehydrogenase [Desulfovibrio sp.]|nr:MAG: aldehyde dehydrogenase [Desulfovibrio sp.]
MSLIPQTVPNLIAGEERLAVSKASAPKYNPATGQELCALTASQAEDINAAVDAALVAQPQWAAIPPVQRGMILHQACDALHSRREDMARIVALETGKSFQDALGETMGAIALGRFYAGEGQRLYGRTTTSGAQNKYAMTIRQPVGLAGLIIAANTPIANVAWKVFPALICGNAALLKASEDAPATAWFFGSLVQDLFPAGTLAVLQGLGREAGAPLVEHPQVDVISFTGSTPVGREIAEVAGRRLAKVSLELGGKNAFVVCDDADLDNAVSWAVLSVFSNAGQRCASAGRIVVFESVYEEFRDKLLAAAQQLNLGTDDGDDLGPVINAESLQRMLGVITQAKAEGARILCGGDRLHDPDHANGYYMAPTVIEGAAPDAAISRTELFGPIACLYPAKDFAQALDLVNDSPYGLTAAIHSRNFNRAWEFAQRVATGVVSINGATYGSEPHMPFGGRKDSGNGSREPGTEALDIYSDLKDVYIMSNPEAV